MAGAYYLCITLRQDTQGTVPGRVDFLGHSKHLRKITIEQPMNNR